MGITTFFILLGLIVVLWIADVLLCYLDDKFSISDTRESLGYLIIFLIVCEVVLTIYLLSMTTPG